MHRSLTSATRTYAVQAQESSIHKIPERDEKPNIAAAVREFFVRRARWNGWQPRFEGSLIVWMGLECLQGILWSQNAQMHWNFCSAVTTKQHGDSDTPPQVSDWGQCFLDRHPQYYTKAKVTGSCWANNNVAVYYLF